MKKLSIACLLCCLLTAACADYDEGLDVLPLTVQLVYPDNTVEPYAGARVELKDALAQVYVDSTDRQGTAHFRVPPGIYEASTSSQFVDSTSETWWRYNFNGVRSQIVVSPDSANNVLLELLMSRKRIVH